MWQATLHFRSPLARPLSLGLALLLVLAPALPATTAAAAPGMLPEPYLVADIQPGSGGSSPAGLTGFDGRLYFAARGPQTGIEPWVSDGTQTGTRLLLDIAPGAGDSNPAGFTALAGKLYFSADDGVYGTEPWLTDGTASGTILLGDINPGSAGSQAAEFTAVGSKLYFAADDGHSGRELWATDGNPGSAYLVADISPGSNGSSPSNLVEFDGRLYFQARGGPETGHELWASDGTAGGTVLLKDINPGARGSYPSDFAPFDGQLYFAAGDDNHGRELWATDGTAAGTLPVTAVGNGGGANPSGLIELGPRLYFQAWGGPETGAELWATDGTPAGTLMVKDIYPGSDGSYPAGFALFHDQLFFRARDAGRGWALWRSDGTETGTALFLELPPADGAYPGSLAALDGHLVFAAATPDQGYEPWLSDGTPDGTHPLKDLFVGKEGSLSGKDFEGFALVGNHLFFAARDSRLNKELWAIPANQPPVVQAGGPYSGREGSTIALSDATAQDPDGDPLTYTWSIGSPLCTLDDPAALQPNLTCSDNGSFAATLTINDSNTGPVQSEATITVENEAPAVEAGDTLTVYRNQSFTVTGTWTDPAGQDDGPYAWSWDLDGDGRSEHGGTVAYGTTILASTSLAREGSYVLTFQVTDADGGTSRDTVTVKVVSR